MTQAKSLVMLTSGLLIWNNSALWVEDLTRLAMVISRRNSFLDGSQVEWNVSSPYSWERSVLDVEKKFFF